MTEEQEKWLQDNPGYETIGKPRADTVFRKPGTLYADGRFEPFGPSLTQIKLEPGCVGVGIAERLFK